MSISHQVRNIIILFYFCRINAYFSDRYFMRPHQFMPMVRTGNWVAKTYGDFTHKPWRCYYVPDVPELPCVKPVATVILVCFLLSLTKEKRRTFRTAIGEGSLIGCYDAKLALDAYWKDIGKPSCAFTPFLIYLSLMFIPPILVACKL